MHNSIAVLSITLTSVLLLAGCSNKDSLLPQPDRDMKTVYGQHMSGIGGGKLLDARSLVRRPIVEGDVNLSDYVRSEKDQLQSKFRMLPNPKMYMFVAPHLATKDDVPIPGYLTEFRMWEKDHYAMPGELSDMRNGSGE